MIEQYRSYKLIIQRIVYRLSKSIAHSFFLYTHFTENIKYILIGLQLNMKREYNMSTQQANSNNL